MNLDNNHEINLDNYDIIKSIGKTPYDNLFLLKCKDDSKLYSLKIHSQTTNLNVFNFLTKFKHPTINNFIGYSTQKFSFEGIDYSDFPNYISLLYEYCLNESLALNISRNILNNTQKQIILVGVSRAISLLHQQNYVHHIITTRKILLDDSFHPHLSGFYEMKQLNPDEMQRFPPITKESSLFSAPEAISKDFYDEKVDIYSFGLVMYSVVTGNNVRYDRMAHRSKNILKSYIESGIRQAFNEPVKESIQNLIEKCWSGDPDVRPTADELFKKLAYDPEYYLDDVDTTVLGQYVSSI